MKLITILTITLFLILTFSSPIKASSGLCTDHIVQSGDWLSKLAEKHLGDKDAWPLIVEATNAHYDPIDDPDVIEPGQKLCIPLPVKMTTEAFLEQQKDPVKVLFTEFVWRASADTKSGLLWRSIAEYPDGVVRECWLTWLTHEELSEKFVSSGCMEIPKPATPAVQPAPESVWPKS